MDKHSPLYTGVLDNSPLGDLWIASTEYGLAAIEWSQDEADFGAYLTKRFKRPAQPDFAKVAPALQQLDEYLRGERNAFHLPIDWSLLRPFQIQVLQIVFNDPLRADPHLRRHSLRDRQSKGRARCGPRQCHQSHAAGHPLPSRYRRGRQADRLRRRAGLAYEGMVVKIGGGGSYLIEFFVHSMGKLYDK